VIRSASAPSPHKVFHWLTGPAKKPSWAVRQGPWKLLGNPQDTSKKAPLTPADRLYLANLENDVSETTNVASEHPEIVARLKRSHEEWVKQVEEQ